MIFLTAFSTFINRRRFPNYLILITANSIGHTAYVLSPFLAKVQEAAKENPVDVEFDFP